MEGYVKPELNENPKLSVLNEENDIIVIQELDEHDIDPNGPQEPAW